MRDFCPNDFLSERLGASAHNSILDLRHPGREAFALTQLAALALGRRDLALAQLILERRCRLPRPAGMHDHLLYHEVLVRSGATTAARVALARAIDLDPTDRLANAALLRHGSAAEQGLAAQRLLPHAHNLAAGTPLLPALAGSGTTAVAVLSPDRGQLGGWVAWREAPQLQLVVVAGERSTAFRIAADRLCNGVASGAWRGTDVRLPITGGRSRQVALSRAAPGAQLCLAMPSTFDSPGDGMVRAAPPARAPQPRPATDRGRAPSENPEAGQDPIDVPRPAPGKVTVVIPVYLDYEATHACLRSILAGQDGAGFAIEVLVVDDASPDQRLSRSLDGLPCQVLRLSTNRGFAGAVNAALAQITDGDVVLLNSDTVVPPGAIARLAATAYAAADIGTVTPLSNNGELTSLPVAFQSNPSLSWRELVDLDQTAARLYGHRSIDLPSGVGFCLYVRRACLDAIGGIPDHYANGYMEDVHFCLAARETGWRNVCALSVHVAHLGSRSFGSTKGALVVRNTARLLASFPDHAGETRAFMRADPLRPIRMALAVARPRRAPIRLIIASRRTKAQARLRLAQLSLQGQASVLLELGPSGRPYGRLYDWAPSTFDPTMDAAPDGAVDLGTLSPIASVAGADTIQQVTRWLEGWSVDGVELCDPALPWVCAAGSRTFYLCDAHDFCKLPAATTAAGSGLGGSVPQPSPQPSPHPPAVARVLAEADRIIPADSQARTFARGAFPEAIAKITDPAWPADLGTLQPSAGAKSEPAAGDLVAIVRIGTSRSLRALVDGVAMALRRDGTRQPVIEVSCSGMASGRPSPVWPLGAVAPSALAGVLCRLGVGGIIVLTEGPVFGHPLQVACARAPLPMAYVDWSGSAPAVVGATTAMGAGRAREAIISDLSAWVRATIVTVEHGRAERPR